PDVEVLAERRPDADLDVVEVDEHGDVDAFLLGQNRFLPVWVTPPRWRNAAWPGRSIRSGWRGAARVRSDCSAGLSPERPHCTAVAVGASSLSLLDTGLDPDPGRATGAP